MIFLSPIARQVLKFLRFWLNAWRKTQVQLLYPDCKFGPDVQLGINVDVRATDGGKIFFGPRVVVKDNCVFVARGGTITIGQGTFIGWGTIICANEAVEIGQDCLIAEHVTIRDQNHGITPGDIPFKDQPMKSAAIRIENNVWIAAKATVLMGCQIGHSSVVGANAVVNKDIPAETVFAGVPAKQISTKQSD